MADSSLQITQGVGTFISTRTNASGEQMQVFVLGVPDSDSLVDAAHPLAIAAQSLPAAGRDTDSIAVALQTGAIMLGLVALTPKFAIGNPPASQTDYNIVTAVATKKIRVHQAMAVAGSAGAPTLVFNSKGAGAGTAISPTIANAANGGEVLPFSPMGWFETNAGEALTVTTGAGAATGILVGYTEV